MAKRDYAREFEELVSDSGYTLLSPYVSATKKVKMLCDKNHEYEVKPNHFKGGRRCPACSGHCPKQANKLFRKLVEDSGYTLLSPYLGAMKKVSICCNKGHEYSVSPNCFKSGIRCAVCSGHCPKASKKDFEKLVEDSGYTLISPYVKNSQKVSIRCSQGHEYSVRPNDFKKGLRCAACSGKCPKKAKKLFEKLVEDSGYTLLSPYVKNYQKVRMVCSKNHEYSVAPNSFQSGSRCPACAGNCPKKAKKAFEKEVSESGYELLSPYVKSKQKVRMVCSKGHEYSVAPCDFKSGCRCPVCSKTNQDKYLYIMRDNLDKRLCKIGISNNPYLRLRFLNKDSNGLHDWEVFKAYDFTMDDDKAYNIEQHILQEYESDRFYSKREEGAPDGGTETLMMRPERLQRIVEEIEPTFF